VPRTFARKILLLCCAIGICLLAGYIGSYLTIPSLPTWYAGLVKPDLNPPSWVFAPVWTLLYILMGLSLYLMLLHGLNNRDVQFGVVLFLVQLLLNVAWSFAFFSVHSIFLALMTIIALWAILLCTIIQAFRISAGAGALLLPYLLWVSFALYLNYAIMQLNPALPGMP
jgi:tryptophan-rich sensory protein